MKVLITGCTAQQASSKTALRTPTFSTLIAQAFSDGGVSVSIAEPSIYISKEELAEYDKVLVGLAPPTSLSANKIYPAFSVASKAKEIGNLALFLDAPEQYKLQSSLKSCYLNMSDLQKEFYSRRKSYFDLVKDDSLKQEVYGFIEFLYNEKWPTTYYPSFPWTSHKTISQTIVNTDEDNLVPVSVDAYLLRQPYVAPNFSLLKEYWTCDSVKTEWSKSITKTLKHQVLSTRHNRWESLEDTQVRIKQSIGTLVSVYRSNESWWSPALAQSLASGVPVVTDWRQSSVLGLEWAHLASTVEAMSDSERFELSVAQKESYLNAVPTWKNTTSNLLQTISLKEVSI
jgi:hypothetical protein